MARSPELRRFLASLQAAPDPRNLAWDTEAVEALGDAERTIAEDALVDRAERLQDLRAIKSLALLGVDRAVPALEALSAAGSPVVRNAADRALGILTGDQATIGTLVDALGGQVDALTAWDLKSMSGDEAFRGLLVALKSADLPARMHALDGLCSKRGVEHLRDPLQAPLGRYELLLGATLRSLYLPAADALTDLFVQLEAGTSPEALGLPYVPSDDPELGDTFWESAGETGEPYADALIDAMGEHDRAWALALVVSRVEEQDVRSLDTIAARDLTWSVPVLEEVADARSDLRPAFAKRLGEALEALRTDTL